MNSILKRCLLFFFDPSFRFERNLRKGRYDNLPDDVFLKKFFKIKMGYPLNLENPKTYNEKLQWLKLNDKNPLYTQLVDKYTVKKYISEKIGEEHVVPTLGIWEKFEDIDFSKLPERFVLKCTHDSGGVLICKDKSKFDINLAKTKIETSLKTNFYFKGREWPYKNVQPRIIAEPFLEDSRLMELRDYKFFCFFGKPEFMYITSYDECDKFVDYFNMEFEHMSVHDDDPNAPKEPQKPFNFEKMKEFASVLSQGIPHVRVDFYEVNGQVFVGEMTFYYFSGFVPFEPKDWDEKFGKYIDIERIRKYENI